MYIILITYFISNFWGADYAYFNRLYEGKNGGEVFEHTTISLFSKVLHFLVYVASLPSLLIMFVQIKVKGEHDLIQGINKLDYLLKVSIFQMYKCDYHEYKLGLLGVMFRDVQKCHVDAILQEEHVDTDRMIEDSNITQ